jgi:hypothetical protein
VLGQEPLRAGAEELALAEHAGGGPEIPRVEEIGKEVLYDPDDLGARRRIALQLEQVEEHVER